MLLLRKILRDLKFFKNFKMNLMNKYSSKFIHLNYFEIYMVEEKILGLFRKILEALRNFR